jgi:hypothetical protein
MLKQSTKTAVLSQFDYLQKHTRNASNAEAQETMLRFTLFRVTESASVLRAIVALNSVDIPQPLFNLLEDVEEVNARVCTYLNDYYNNSQEAKHAEARK